MANIPSLSAAVAKERAIHSIIDNRIKCLHTQSLTHHTQFSFRQWKSSIYPSIHLYGLIQYVRASQATRGGLRSCMCRIRPAAYYNT